jgi:O-antigen/teichoic acid export membrane protein
MEDGGRPAPRPRISPGLLVFLAEALAVPTGLLTVIYLSRKLGAEDYGAYVLAAVVVGWAQMVLASLLGRPAQSYLARSEAWRGAAADIVYLHAALGLGATAIIALSAPLLAGLLKAPQLGRDLPLFALDVLLFIAGQGLRAVALARSRFGLRAGMAAMRWISRLILVCGLASTSLGVTGAILGNLAASALELLLGLVRLRLPRPNFTLTRLPGFWRVAAPLSISSISLRLFERADLLAVQAMAGVVATGLYGVAQNVTMLAGVFGMSLAGVLMTQVSALRDDARAIADISRESFRSWLRLAPPAALGAVLAKDVVLVGFGAEYAAAGPLASMLAWGALAMIGTALATAILVGAGHNRLVLTVTAPALPLAIVGHLILTPRYGPLGAAACTTGVAAVSAIAAWMAVRAKTGFAAPVLWTVRSLAICAVILLAASWGPLLHLEPVARAFALTGVMLAALLATGEVRISELRGAARRLVVPAS